MITWAAEPTLNEDSKPVCFESSVKAKQHIKIPFQNQLWGNPRTKWSFIAGTSNKTPDFHGQAFRLTRKGWAEAADVGTPKRL
jgi:hypothetical protein